MSTQPTTYKCDRCKEVEPYNPAWLMMCTTMHDERWDLCAACSAEFKEFLKGKSK